MRRRELILGLGAAFAAPPAVQAQDKALPVIGYLNPGWPGLAVHLHPVLLQGLAESGYVDGRNVVINYNYAEGRYDRLPQMASQLVRDEVSVIIAIATAAALAAKGATRTIPVVFGIPNDPVELGIVATLARPGDNVTGVSFLAAEVRGKQLELLRELLPNARRIGLLVNPNDAHPDKLTDLAQAAKVLGVHLLTVQANNDREIEAAFDTFVKERVNGFVAGTGVFLYSRRGKIAELAARDAIPFVANAREHVDAGGLISY
jgi:putative ABC transport system substrate-binding protein